MLCLGQWVASRWLIVTHRDMALPCPGSALWLDVCFIHALPVLQGFPLGAPRSSVASEAGLEPGAPRGALAPDLRNGHLVLTHKLQNETVPDFRLLPEGCVPGLGHASKLAIGDMRC